jgi:hypothetical protein
MPRSAAVADSIDWPGFQAQHHGEPPRRSAVEVRLLAANQRLGPQRNRHVEGAADFRSEKLRRRDADDGEGHAFDDERLADGVGGAAELALPEA